MSSATSGAREPLSWAEARRRLKMVVEQHLDRKENRSGLLTPTASSATILTSNSNSNSTNTNPAVVVTVDDAASVMTGERTGWLRIFQQTHVHQGLRRMVRCDLDLYIGALGGSLALWALSLWAVLSNHPRCDDDDAREEESSSLAGLQQSQLTAACFLVVSSLLSVWVVRRRRFLRLHDGATTREVLRFWRSLKALDDEGGSESFSSRNALHNNNNHIPPDEAFNAIFYRQLAASMANTTLHRNVPDQVQLHGTSLTDMYRVFRCRRSSNNSTSGMGSTDDLLLDYCWTQVPSLLLVQGDWIALQCGDVAPADCVMLYGGSLTPIHVSRGCRLTLEQMGSLSADTVLHELPEGRTTLPPASKHLLTLTNQMRVFLVLETPLRPVLDQPPATSRPSQNSRQIEAARQALLFVAVVLVIFTAVVLGLRTWNRQCDVSFLIWSLPMLVAIAVLPITGPSFLFFLEALATARILATVHPHASFTVTPTNQNHNVAMETSTNSIFSMPHYLVGSDDEAGRSTLVLRYFIATCLSRLSLWKAADHLRRFTGRSFFASRLIRIPPASLNLVEKLGVATAFALVDDELACEPHAIPQQLLVPSGQGLKLLDLCARYDSDSEQLSESESDSSKDSDSDSEDSQYFTSSMFNSSVLKRKILRRRNFRRGPRKDSKRKKEERKSSDSSSSDSSSEDSHFEVQFEEPTWWTFLPSLKCIGLAGLLTEENIHKEEDDEDVDVLLSSAKQSLSAEDLLVRATCRERSRDQHRSLAQCIGFSTEPNDNGPMGDISAFSEKLRLHIISSQLVRERIVLDLHERSTEQSKWWGHVLTDSTSVIVQDSRSKAYQLLTVGDPSVVVDLCQEAWQGQISTIVPLRAVDRETILETSDDWKLGDLDVTAFSYTPMARSMEAMLESKTESQVYLLDHFAQTETRESLHRSNDVSEEWSLMKNQIFLGLLGSLVIPRNEIQTLLAVLSDAGVRFVYFSPRNMRRQKELASQMGIDVAWNCAISLRPLESGKEDKYRMTSHYADWDVNAKLPHGVEDVRKHLEEVDNVPLLVSLYTDVTKDTTREMIDIFQDYSDTVISVGLSHLPQNDGIFAAADIAVGIDVLSGSLDPIEGSAGSIECDYVLPSEFNFASSISSRACAFRLKGIGSISQLTGIIEQGRASLEAALSATFFLIFGFLSLSFYIFMSACLPSTSIPYVPVLGVVLYLQLGLPGLGFVLAMSDGDPDTMQRVPPKNDPNIAFSRREDWKYYRNIGLKALVPALLPQVLHFIAFGELMLHFEQDWLDENCPGKSSWLALIRCAAIADHGGGKAHISAGILVLVELNLCVCFASASFLSRVEPLSVHVARRRNRAWSLVMCIIIILSVVYGHYAMPLNVASALPWYFYLLAAFFPFMCLFWVEWCKRLEIPMEKRAETLRRLQFETRLGAWSPK